MAIPAVNNRNNRYAPDRIPPRPSALNDGASGPVPRPHNHQPPPPYEPFHPRPGGGNQGNYPIRLIRRGPPPRPATIIKLEGSRCFAVTLLIVFTLAALFIPFRSGSSQPKIARKSSLPHGAFWDPITPTPDCRAYGEREYHGTLQNIPKNWADMDACMAMPAEIKRVTLAHPHRCGYIEGSPHIHGFWMVDWDQPDCKPWHKDVTDEGCLHPGSGTRRIEAWVVDINDKPEQDWRLLCESTPFAWNHVTYNSPTRCEARWPGKKFAIWDIPDDDC